MQQRTLEIINKLGLHARAASKLATLANRFESRIQVSAHGKTTDAKSIMSLMLLAASIGTEIELITEGPDEVEAITALKELINNRFDEEE
ncbi:phosphocarrier protein HPr [Teredinibacter turnerae T7901]|uniref:Phosphocarrier protein HPr n=1 Tax=Teredinibacter turnerae (strain ATCC 39867 / T7901) TaxID=377629 RepID=C5BSX7_TERTT|nr:HPr family phosphocarrier protein [Teredinibacter turnerae]ACR12776.1 phosphocarrier protein HPr [Teredinibacter turnerae T7901]